MKTIILVIAVVWVAQQFAELAYEVERLMELRIKYRRQSEREWQRAMVWREN